MRHRAYPFRGIRGLGVVGLFATTGIAMVGAIWAIYLDSFLHNEAYVGLLSSLFTIVAIVSYFFIIPLVEKTSKSKLYIFALIAYVTSYLLFALLPNLYAMIILGIIVSFVASLKITCFGIMVRDKTKDKDVVKNEGIVYTSLNIAWLLGPLVAGFLAEKYGLGSVFLIASFLVVISLFLFKSFKITDNRVNKRKDKNILKVFLQFFKKKERVICYALGGGVNFWWALVYVYIPLQMIKAGLDDMMVGIFLFAVAIPLVLSEYYFSRISSKSGFKIVFSVAYLSLIIISLICFFLTNIYIILGVLVLASFALAMIEPTTEAYFFDIITKNQRDKYYGPYNTAVDVGYYAGTFISALILLVFVDFKYVFLFYSLAMFIFLLTSLKIKNVIEDKR